MTWPIKFVRLTALCLFWTATWTTVAVAGDLSFSAPQFLPGDELIAAAAGMQVESDIARGNEQFLMVFSDGRTTPDDYYPFATEGSGTDIYGVRLDVDGNAIDACPFVINQDLGDQVEPRVAFNGENWLVVWRQSTVTLPTYDMIMAARVGIDGTVLDESPIVVLNNQSYFYEPAVQAGGGDWVVLTQSNGPFDGLVAVRVTGDGQVANPGGLQLHETFFLLDYDLAFAEDEYLITWGGSFDTPRGRLFSPMLAPLGNSFALPLVGKVATDGVDFVLVQAEAQVVDAVLVTHDGAVPNPAFNIFTAGGQAGACCPNVTWDGNFYWANWGQLFLARITFDGELLDPGGMQISFPESYPISSPRFAPAAKGGLQMTFNDGVNGADYPKDTYTAQISVDGQLQHEVLVSTGAPAQLDADFAAGDGLNLVVFRSRFSEDGRILAQRLDVNGTALDAEPIEVASGPIPGLGLPTLSAPAAAWNGSLFMITWSDGLQIYARRMLADGSFLDDTPLTVMDGFDPDVAAAGETFLVVGIDLLQNNSQWQATHAMRVDGVTGENLDAQSIAIGGFVIFAQHPHVVGWGDRWLATWQTNASHDEPNASVRAAIVEADGSSPDGVFFVSFGGWRPDVAVSDNEALFVWSNGSIASADSNIQGRRMLPDGTFPAAEFIVAAAPDRQLYPTVTWDGEQFIAAWQDKRNSEVYFDERTDIYGARITPDGQLVDLVSAPIATSSVPDVWPTLMSSGDTTLLAVSTFRPESPFGAYRVGIQVHGDFSLPGDADGDGIVGISDLLAVIGSWGPCGGCAEDMDGSGTVDVIDLLMVLSNWSV